MLIPAAMKELDKAHTAFGQAARENAVRRVGARFARVRPVQLERGGGLSGKVREIGHGLLHPKRHFILRDAAGDFGVEIILVRDLVELAKIVKKTASRGGVIALRI